MALVYILSDHNESGAEHVVATLDPSKLPEMIERNWPNTSFNKAWKDEQRAAWLAEAIAALTEIDLIEISAERGKPLHDGWGGIQLHIVELV
jgi:hypothetical protein